MKKTISYILAVCICIVVTGCGPEEGSGELLGCWESEMTEERIEFCTGGQLYINGRKCISYYEAEDGIITFTLSAAFSNRTLRTPLETYGLMYTMEIINPLVGEGTLQYSLNLDGNELTLTNEDGEQTIYQKVK